MTSSMTSQNTDLPSWITQYKRVKASYCSVGLLREPYEAHNTGCAEMRSHVICDRCVLIDIIIILVVLILLFTAIEFSLGGSSP